MPKQTKSGSENKTNGANLGFETQMWAAADKLRGHMDASEYKHVVLGLIFLYPLCKRYLNFKQNTAPESIWRFF